MLFDKPSLRTRTTFEIAVRELGGQVVALQPDVALGQREPVADVARNLERWVDAVVIRTFSQHVLEEFAAAGAAAARHQRAHRRGASLPGARRLPDAAGAHRAAARPDDRLRRRRQQRRGVAGARGGDARRPRARRQPRAAISCRMRSCSRRRRVARHGARLRLFTDAADAVAGADAVYTDTWTSMGQEAEAELTAPRVRRLSGQRGADGAGQAGRALHALPAGAPRRGGHRRRLRVAKRRSSSIRPRTACTCQKALLLMLLAPSAGL